jgi:periplasmic divalent cation tolerance protein
MSYCVINCTTANKNDALILARELVKKKLIACCNIIPNIISVYNWDNQLNEDNECLMIMKTKLELFKEVEKEIKKNHKYKVPEIICTPIIEGNCDYLNWVKEQTL